MPRFHARALPAFADNYVWLLAGPGDRVVVVDPGDPAPVLRAAAEGLEPVAVVVTHHHDDHIGGLGALLSAFDIPCYAPDDARIARASARVSDGERVHIEALGLDLEVLAVPGHTRSHVAYHGGGHLFCGDTLFSLGCGRLFEGTPATMLGSLDKLAALPDDTAVCCAHEYTVGNGRFARAAEPENPDRDRWLQEVGERRARGEPSLPSRIGTEKAGNPFLRCDQPGLLATLAARAGREPDDRVGAFAQLRAWKDGFAA